ncbi:efflux transporter outer membrane subunit [Caballeronia sp. GAFFF2]|uniref:efflux transporter outer membrane subunit n=1 Tax=Caballeronia sp. GAFFF2 TaxID=2921741 RepID=UPI002028352C|nr:efflux transporter outer membrane subunit [Caballeronia sp. GAFFF2]
MISRRLSTIAKRSSEASFACAVLSIAGCVAPQLPGVPPAEVPVNWSAPTAANGSNVAEEWWREFGDERLNRLVRSVVESNTDLLIAADRLRQVQLEATNTSTDMTPRVTVGGNIGWGTESLTLRRMRSRGGDVNASLNYDLDVGGKLAAERDSANWLANAEEHGADWARLGIISACLKNYWMLGLLNERLTLSKDRLAYAKRTLAIVQARYDAGSASRVDVVQARQTVLAEEVTIDQIAKELLQNRNALAILVGGPPETAIDIPDRLITRSLPPVAAGLPADVIHRRADVRAAEWRVRQTLANIDVARASLYPSLSLTSSVGTLSDDLARFLTNPVANVGLAIALPFVDWNRTQLRIKVSQSDYNVAALQFRKAIYIALQEVEDRLTASAQFEREEAKLQERLEQSRLAERLAKARFTAGETDVQPWLQSQQSVQQIQEALAQNHFDRLTTRAALLVALGGGDKGASPKVTGEAERKM